MSPYTGGLKIKSVPIRRGTDYPQSGAGRLLFNEDLGWLSAVNLNGVLNIPLPISYGQGNSAGFFY